MAMTRILDGDLSTKVLNVSVPAEKFPLLKMRLNAISRRIQGMETKSCKLCSILQSSFVHHGANNAALDFVKPACMQYFYNRASANITCPCSDIAEYHNWLFSYAASSSISGFGQVPNILLLLEAIMRM